MSRSIFVLFDEVCDLGYFLVVSGVVLAIPAVLVDVLLQLHPSLIELLASHELLVPGEALHHLLALLVGVLDGDEVGLYEVGVGEGAEVVSDWPELHVVHFPVVLLYAGDEVLPKIKVDLAYG